MMLGLGMLLPLPAGPAWAGTVEIAAADTAALSRLLVGQTADAMLVDGTIVHGKVLDVDEGELEIRVTRSSGTDPLDEGEQTIPVRDVATVILHPVEGHSRWILTPVVALGVAGLGVALYNSGLGADKDHSNGGLVAALTAGGGTIGYLWGRHRDRRELTVVLRH